MGKKTWIKLVVGTAVLFYFLTLLIPKFLSVLSGEQTAGLALILSILTIDRLEPFIGKIGN